MARRQAGNDGHVESGAGWAKGGRRAVDTRVTRPRAILAAVETTRSVVGSADAPWSLETSLAELARLADTGDIEVVGTVRQKLPALNPVTYFGQGKVAELKQVLEAENGDIALFDDELSPHQLRHLEDVLGPGRVVDRTQLILDIFAARAHTREGALQVQLARTRYQIPRLRQLWTHLERQRGGTFTRGGAGETQMETDRRVLKNSLKRLEEELDSVRARRSEQRRHRRESWPTATLVGYTNAGKSTLLNRLTGSQVAARDQLFATLDPTTRQWDVAERSAVLLTDTVGFIHKLPAALVAAFRATLEEATEADLLLHVIDASSMQAEGQAAVVLDELETIGACAPVLTVLNKSDALVGELAARRIDALRATFPEAVFVSGTTGAGCSELAALVLRTMQTQTLTRKVPILALR